ncbi:hypothetical protein GCM10011374_36280 [Kocuria dechangensis]|uniref:Uncharacterized protein n=1 Tax=Kocuria dechangensis TaxID=1176249 RepID=A0A917H730_9MICC|nr:hypothetical protein [Kocuria dechangensis]GGG68632.1 hypothetical protein GCM10011374_36280 [Kocuria dechangensis]
MNQTLEKIHRTTVPIRLAVEGDELVVEAESLNWPTQTAPATKRLPLPKAVAVRVDSEELEYPEYTDAPGPFEDAVGQETLRAAIREVGDTAIAHLVGIDDYLRCARSVSVDHHETGLSISVHALRLDLSTGLVNPDPAQRTASLTLHADPVESHDGASQTFTWPSTQAPDLLPELSGEPMLALALRLIGGGE